MSQSITYANFRDKILRDMDLEQEEFITPTELIGYTNIAIDDAEALIHGLYEDYFLATDNFVLVNATQDYTLPADIYGDKLRKVVFTDNPANPGAASRVYKVRQIKQFENTLTISNDEKFGYILFNNSTGRRMRFFPIPQTAYLGTIVRFYIRNANRIDDTASQATIDATLIDIPEFQSFLFAHVKLQIAQKEKFSQDIQTWGAVLEAQRQLMEDTLTSRVIDEDDWVPRDLGYYYDFYYNDESYYNI